LHLGNEEIWKTAEQQLKNALGINKFKNNLDNSNMKYTIHEGHGAFYGPKIDFHLKDLLGRSH
jgi:threonyl-tRNA synthetase